MNIRLHNQLVNIRNEIYHLARESNCLCKNCRDALLENYEELNDIIEDEAKE